MSITLAKPLDCSPELLAAILAIGAADDAAGFELDDNFPLTPAELAIYENDGVMCGGCFKVAPRDAAEWDWSGVGCASCDDLCADCGPEAEGYLHGMMCRCPQD